MRQHFRVKTPLFRTISNIYMLPFFLAFASCQEIAEEQSAEKTTTNTTLLTVTVSEMRLSSIKDGWLCNSDLPKGELVDRMNGYSIRRIGPLEQDTETRFDIYLFAVEIKNQRCRFIFTDDTPDSKFHSPAVHRLEPEQVSPFSTFLANEVKASSINCRPHHTRFNENTDLACRENAEKRVVRRSAQFSSRRPRGNDMTGVDYLIFDGEIIRED